MLCHSRSTAVSHSVPEEERQRPEDGGLRAPSPLVHGRISSDDSEAEGPEDHYEFSSSAAHPRPVVVSGHFPGSRGTFANPWKQDFYYWNHHGI